VSGTLLVLLVVLLLIAAWMRGDFALTLIYLVVGGLAAGFWWSRRTLTQVKTRRHFNTHAFLGEKIKVDLHVQNASWLPIPWLELRETLPVALAGPHSFRSVIHLPAQGDAKFEYSMDASKRGYYSVGPLFISAGDILGLSDALQTETEAEHVVVYPRIVPFTSVDIPSRSPQGTMRHSMPLFEDPTRAFGKRGYVSGDSLRRIDWKASASTGRLQVKLFEPSIALETCIILNLNAEDYYYRSRIDSIELAIVIAASISNWIIEKKQMAGLTVNGRDPLTADGRPQPLSPRKGKQHLMHLLETLARADAIGDSPLVPLLQQQRYQLAWGTTLIVITGQAGDDVLNELHQARREGQNAILILAGRDGVDDAIRLRGKSLGIPVYFIATERDLQIWMQGSRRT
jgi:uncharacterized protein (DUF58 family)